MAGVVIAILLIVALIIVGVVVGILFWMYQPWSNGWFGIEARLSNHKRYAGLSYISGLDVYIYILHTLLVKFL